MILPKRLHRAAAISLLKQASDDAQYNYLPYLVGALLGGGVGAGTGYWLGGDKDEETGERTHRGRAALLGGLTGAGLGTLGGGLYSYRAEMSNQLARALQQIENLVRTAKQVEETQKAAVPPEPPPAPTPEPPPAPKPEQSSAPKSAPKSTMPSSTLLDEKKPRFA